MNKKNMILVIFIILGFTMCLGCTESDTGSVNSVESEEMQTGVIKAEGIEGETQQTNQSSTLSSDAEWESSYRNGCFLLASDFESISNATDNNDYKSLENAGNKLEADALMKLEESQKYQLSSSSLFQYVKSEYESALLDFVQLGKYYSLASIKMQDGDVTGANVDLQTAQTYQNLAGEHMQNIVAYAPDTDLTDSTQTEKNSGVIATWSGSSIKDTETFHVDSNEWKISWNTEPGQYGAMNFQIYVYGSDGTLKGVAANVIGSNSDSTIMRGSGDYYLSINTAQPYEITIESLN
ncbi:hypothetical protein [Methanosarcina sp. 2.H.A.1B.4]|uniref:hypothetical protein n=1 Tax=Methanosarcina sp. 2.H.A.1B.4 TaxID=1483600 RepID=UPI0006210345|nr:hypothetical protein [Methanosarcina sp. 2.H.A.1B.4]KKG10463.1 hypothetical protein EO92_05615 [Methanosarcina sp. 2.H.A.1B.4]